MASHDGAASGILLVMSDCDPSFWVDVGKTLIGAAAGASFAFAFASWRARQTRHDERKAAGNLALFILHQQHHDAIVVCAAALRDQKLTLEKHKTAPVWAQTKPMTFFFRPSLTFDLKSLAFLFSRGRTELFKKVAGAEATYYDLADVLANHRQAMGQLQEKLTAIGVVPGVPFNVDQAEGYVGADIVAKAKAASASLLDRCKDIETTFTGAYELLRGALVEEFDDASIVSLEFAKMADLKAKVA